MTLSSSALSDYHDKVERQAARVVQLIQTGLDRLRSMPELAPPTLTLTLLSKNQPDVDLTSFQLYTRLVAEDDDDDDDDDNDDDGGGYLARVNEACRAVQDALAADKDKDQDDTIWSESASVDYSQQDQRARLVNKIILPLLRALGRCYTVLDRIPTPSVPPQQQQQPTTTKASLGRRPPNANAPPPPIGMLSIQNYTDIACLLELLVCTSILPLLEPHIVATVADRVTVSLPKALKGRIARKTLTWASAQSIVPGNHTDSRRWYEMRDSVAAAGNLILLDRFRHMLLPRHLTDLYAALFQLDRRKETISTQLETTSSSFESLCVKLETEKGETTNGGGVDAFLQARSYQTLLSQGMKAPVWLRQRVSKLLAQLACNDLEAIVQVFVNAALVEDRSAATMRLVRALVAGKQTDAYYVLICKQLVQLLDTVSSRRGMQPKQARTGDSSSIFMVWAVLDQLPDRIVLGPFLKLVAREIVSAKAAVETTGVHRCIRRIAILLPSVPTPLDSSKVCRIMLSPLTISGLENEGTKPTLVSMLLQLASIPSVLKLIVKDDALWALQTLVCTFSMTTFKSSKECTSVSGVDVLAMALVYSLGPSQWDLAGYRFSGASSVANSLYDLVRLERADDGVDVSAQKAALDIQTQASVVVRDLVLPLAQNSEDENKGKDTVTLNIVALPSHLVQVLLAVLFGAGLSNSSNGGAVTLPVVLREGVFLMVAMVTLPILCEECPLESLLLNGGESAVLDISSLVFRFAAIRLGPGAPTASLAGQAIGDTPLSRNELTASGAIFAELIGSDALPKDQADEKSNLAADDEMLVSICSVLLSLLIGMLELGVKERSSTEEAKLCSIQTVLRPLADYSPDSGKGPLSAARAELSEMSSHAMALIAARGAPSQDEMQTVKRKEERTSRDIIMAKIAQAGKDLKSSEPPMRARGVVSLRHIASALSSQGADRPRLSHIVEVEEWTEDLLQRTILLTMVALRDKESYVYLAAVQTLVAIADVNPASIVPILGSVVGTGIATLADGSEVDASPDQRIKLTEALIFVIRKRAAIHEYVPALIDMMIYGSQLDDAKVAEEDDSAQVQSLTHDFFVHGFDPTFNQELSAEERNEEMSLRLRTGGPLFSLEEGDTVRASRITVVAELVLVAHPSISARHCHVLVQSAVDALRLEASRPVRRAGAFLASALYDALIREQNDMLNASPVQLKKTTFPLAVAIASAGEEGLYVAIERCLSGNDVDDLQGVSRRVSDPATQVRCQEALDARNEAESGGILAAGRLAARTKKADDSHRIANILREPLRGRSEKVATLIEIVKEDG